MPFYKGGPESELQLVSKGFMEKVDQAAAGAPVEPGRLPERRPHPLRPHPLCPHTRGYELLIRFLVLDGVLKKVSQMTS